MEQFKNVIQNMILLFESLEKWEQKKLEAVTKNKITLLEETMNKEQAEILKLRGKEKELYTIQKQNGWEGKSFREIIELIPVEERYEYEELFQKFSKSIERFQGINEEAKKSLSLQIHAINKVMQENGMEYTNSGVIQNKKKSLTTTRV